MNQKIRITPSIVRLLVLSIALFICIGPSITYGQWVWEPVTPVSQIEGGCCHNQVVVVEGQVTDKSGFSASWNIYEFTDGSDTTFVNFEDNLPDSAIIRNTTVRILGVVNQGDMFTDINVSGVQTLGTVPLQVTATAAQVNSGSLDDQYVVLEGQVGNKLNPPDFPSQWNVYQFTDSSGTTAIDFENELRASDFPEIKILVPGTVDDYNPRKVDDPTMFVGAGTPADQFNLKVNRAGDGSGTVTSSPSGINCGSTCTAAFDSGASVTLTATPEFGSEFSSWSGCDQAQVNKCTVTMSAAKTVTATFTGGGSSGGEWVWGPVTPISQIANGGCCDEQTVVVEGKIVRKTAYPEEWMIYEFTDGTDTTLVNFEDNLPDSAIILNTTVRIIGVVQQGDMFTDVRVAGLQTQGTVPLQATATAADVNSGREIDRFAVLEGKIKNQKLSSFPADWNVYEFTDNTGTTGVDFEDDLQLQSKDFPQEVILVSGAGDDTSPRTLEDSTMWVGAGTPPEKYKLTVTKSGDGSGTVTSAPPLINCGSTCEASFDEGTTVTLTATADAGSKFDGWVDCNDTQANTCTVEITQKKLITASFTFVGGEPVPRYRLYNPNTFVHFYTTDANEYNVLGNSGWTQEGVSSIVYNAVITIDSITAVPYFRLYNPHTGIHFWTTDANEYNVLGNSGWTQEGEDGYIFPSQVSGTNAWYRLYNPHSGLHFWTSDANERNVLINSGFNDEGIVGYVYLP